MGTLMFAGALVASLLGGTPIKLDDMQIQGRIQKPQAFWIVRPPKAIDMSVALDRKALVEARARLAKGPRLAPDLVLMARARAAETQAQLLDAFDAYQRSLDCYSRGECGAPPIDPPVADHREAIGWLDEAAKAPGAEAVAIERLALTAQLANEAGPAQDLAREKQALLELAPLAPTGAIGQWARMTLGERLFDAGDLKQTRTIYEQAIEADPSSSLVAFIRYKLAWTLFNLDDAPAAITQMTSLLDPSSGRPELVPEAEHDLIVFYATRPELVDAGMALFIAKTGPRANANLLALLEAYIDVALPVPARAVLAALDKRDLTVDQRARVEGARAHLATRP